MEITDEPGEEIIKVLASPAPLNIKMAKARIMESGDDYMTQISFDEALRTIRDMIAQLKKQDIWYEGTKKYMNHTHFEARRVGMFVASWTERNFKARRVVMFVDNCGTPF